MKIRKHFSLFTLLAAITIITLLLAVSHYFSDSQRYKRSSDGESLRRILATRVSTGDSIETVFGLLGTGRRQSDTIVGKLLEWQNSKKFPSGDFPMGIQEGDAFIAYEAKPGRVSHVLQFRDRTLINFDPGEFATPNPPAEAFLEAN